MIVIVSATSYWSDKELNERVTQSPSPLDLLSENSKNSSLCLV